MAALWMEVLSVFVLVVHSAEAEVSLSQVYNMVDQLYAYTPKYPGENQWPMFSGAVSVPKIPNTNQYDFNRVFEADSVANVKDAMTSCKVYAGKRVVAATVLKYPDSVNRCPNEPVEWSYVRNRNNCPDVRIWADFRDKNKCSDAKIQNLLNSGNNLADHAELRVLSKFQTTFNTPAVNKKDDLMLFYVFKNPCSARCLNSGSTFNILKKITDIKQWTNNYAFVFTNMFVPYGTEDLPLLQENTKKTLLTLGAEIGLKNIYRCPHNSNRCFRCSSQGAEDKVNDGCVAQ